MNLAFAARSLRDWLSGIASAWDRFWFTPQLPHTLSLLRIAAGLMLLYSHLVLAADLMSFLGEHAWINDATIQQLHDGSFAAPDEPTDYGRSYLWLIRSEAVLWAHHGFTILVTAAFAIGLLTRITAPLACGLQLMYLHRLTGTLFGLDQIVTYTTMYLVIAPAGACYSVDAWIGNRFAARRESSRWWRWMFPDASASVSAGVATRLLQLHLCVIYLFGGLSKARGETWWDGTAMWYSVGNYEYQSWADLTWLANFPRVSSALTHGTLFWETFYCALVWPRLTRPFVLAMALMVHGGIAMCLGMVTFGVMMISANMIFVKPEWIVAWLHSGGEAAIDEASAQSDSIDPQALTEREERLRKASRRLQAKTGRLKERESKYRERVTKLKDREAKIKRLIERRRGTKNDGT